jgi:hypothetical protein
MTLAAVGVVAMPAELAGAQSLAPTGAGVAEIAASEVCSSQCYGWGFDTALNGTFTLDGTLQVASLTVGAQSIYTELISQSATSVTFAIPTGVAFLRGSIQQGQSVSGTCGGTVTVTGDVTDGRTPVGAVTVTLLCTASVGAGPSEPLSISIDGAEATEGVPSQYEGLGTYTTSLGLESVAA